MSAAMRVSGRYGSGSLINPYLRLLRLDHPTGFFLLLWPCWWSIGFAIQDSFPWGTFALFLAGALLMRSAGCIINDIIDRKLDANVERTRNRPLANGDIPLWQAVVIAVLFLFAAFCLLMMFNITTIILGALVMVPVVVYPFMKRITYWPQIFLGFTFNWGVLMGWAAMRDELSFKAVLIYLASFLWTMGYDTVYAHQDKEGDVALGLKSTALRFGANTKRYLAMFYTGAMVLLWVVGVASGMGFLFYVFFAAGGFFLFWQIASLQLDNPADCMAKFVSNRYFGFIIFIGIISGKLTGFW